MEPPLPMSRITVHGRTSVRRRIVIMPMIRLPTNQDTGRSTTGMRCKPTSCARRDGMSRPMLIGCLWLPSLGVDSLAGGKLKDAGSIDWYLPNLYATNSTGFTALPSGYRFFNGSYNNVGYSGNWWSSTEYAASAARYFYLVYNKGTTGRNFIDKLYGLSVRCIQN
jgi:hypothetical protein